jgi:DNA segregation ATPase FtsK/SpoIIIE, S-DNA-T family
MRKEIAGILIFFLFVLIIVSLLSYSPADPSIHNATATSEINNLFGLIGAHLAGLLIGLFGLGAFWIPVLLFFGSIHLFRRQPVKNIYILITLFGSLLLVITSGSLFSINQDHYFLFGNQFSSGGMIGIPFKSILFKYANPVGGMLILAVLWIIGLIMATGLSLFSFVKIFFRTGAAIGSKINDNIINLKEKTKESKKSIEYKETQKTKKTEKKIQKNDPIQIITTPRQTIVPKSEIKQENLDFIKLNDEFKLPSLQFLQDPDPPLANADDEHLRMQSQLLEEKLEDFGVKGKVVAITPGPVITTFEYEPARGVKINKIVNLSDDLALALRAMSIRIVAPIPGKAVIGIEIPNVAREIVRFKEVVNVSCFEKSKYKLTLCLGKDIVGNPVLADLAKMPHLLIAGATGTGKSVGLNTMICSILYKATPEEAKFIMIDPKRIELTSYDGIPHLITPVVTDVKKATNALFWAVKEMERRYELLSEKRVRNIAQYNQKISKEKKNKTDLSQGLSSEVEQFLKTETLPYIIIIIDELADLMMVTSKDVEFALTRLAQMARASGIHLILATQRPSVDVLTGIIKANFPTRLTFQVSSRIDSRTIIDTNGAEQLLGNGDMLFLPPGTARLQRIHGSFISEEEINLITEFLKRQKSPEYDISVTESPSEEKDELSEDDYDERYDDAVALVTKNGQASISMIQRHLRIGYNRAARIIEVMEKEGIVGPSDGAKAREVLARNYDGMP